MSLLMICSACTTNTSAVKSDPALVPDRPPQRASAPTCDEVLNKCMDTVGKQKEAIKAKDVVIKAQDELLATKDQQIDNQGRENNLWKTMSTVLAVILAIKLL